MPILNADKAQSIIVLKRSMNPGFAGIENELFYNDKTSAAVRRCEDVAVEARCGDEDGVNAAQRARFGSRRRSRSARARSTRRRRREAAERRLGGAPRRPRRVARRETDEWNRARGREAARRGGARRDRQRTRGASRGAHACREFDRRERQPARALPLSHRGSARAGRGEARHDADRGTPPAQRPRYIVSGNLVAIHVTPKEVLAERVENVLTARHAGAP